MNNVLTNSLIKELNYHDGEVLEIKYIDNNLLLKFIDGWNVGQVNELIFINGKENSKYDLVNRCIYQLDDLVSFEKNHWIMSLLIWMNESSNSLLEKVDFEATDIITNIYENDVLIDSQSLSDLYIESDN